ncbi:MAG: hypothetical protein AAGJ50_06375 [Pseudomonadota bacterium]
MKTTTDIWQEIREEKDSFRRVMRALIILLAVAALIALGVFYYSYRTLTAQEARYTAEVWAIEVRGEISRGDATRDIQTVLTRTLEIREELARGANAGAFADRADRVEERGASQSDIDLALEEARLFTLGANLDGARSQLIKAVYADQCAEPASLGAVPCQFLKAVLADWADRDNRDAGSDEPSERLDIDTPQRLRNAYAAVIELESDLDISDFTPNAEAGLAQLYYAYADNNQLGRDRDCQQVILAAARAETAGARGMGPYLRSGHCLRKQGRFMEANRMFQLARDWYEAAQKDDAFDESRFPPDIFRWAYHGAGTTAISIVASGALDGDENVEARADQLRTAEANLRIAAQRREDRGEGDVGRVYTTENIGFIYVLREDWPTALFHTRDVHDVVPLAWNLVVRRIAAGEIYNQMTTGILAPNAGLSSPEDAKDIACDAERVLKAMRYQYFDEDEVLNLLPDRADYRSLVEDLVAKPKLEYERRQRAAETRQKFADVAFPTSGQTYYGTDLCRPTEAAPLLPF